MNIRLIWMLILSLLLASCATVPPPDNTSNICRIFQQYPEWYLVTKRTEQRWGVPVAVQMAIINQESSFVSDARPPRTKLLYVIPWTRPTSAYGYSQAINHTWHLYQQSTGHYYASRDEFADADNFVGWYASRAHSRAGISPNNAYQLYLAYHEGITNYKNKTYLAKPWLMRVAAKVKSRAQLYNSQLKRCLFYYK